nr:hypothetical protein [Comamonas testosteroni]
MPIKQMAELIQCHSCNFLSQYALWGELEEAAVIQNLRRDTPALSAKHISRWNGCYLEICSKAGRSLVACHAVRTVLLFSLRPLNKALPKHPVLRWHTLTPQATPLGPVVAALRQKQSLPLEFRNRIKNYYQ